MSTTFPGDGGITARVGAFCTNSENPVAKELVADLLALVEGAVRNARPRQLGKHVRWSAVRDAFGIGSTSAQELCRAFKLDPDEEIDGPSCESCDAEAAEDVA